MNLKEIREEIEAELVFAPDVQAHRKDLRRVINRVYRTLMVSFDWTFRRREFQLPLFADLDIASADLTVVGGTSPFELRFAIPAGWTESDIYALAGQEFRFVAAAGASLDEPLEAPDSRYIIERSRKFFDGLADVVSIFLDARFVVAALAGNESGTVRFGRYVLPQDVADIQSIMSRDDDRGPIYGLSVATESDIMLNSDIPGPPAYFLPVETISSQTHSTYQRNLANHEWREVETRGPRKPFTVASDAAAGTLVVGQLYQYLDVWVVSGRLSARSEIVEHTHTGASGSSILLSGLETATSGLGRVRYVFRREGKEGAWHFDGEETDPTVGTYASTVGDLPGTDPRASTRYVELQEHGAYRYVRFWPRPESDRLVSIYYLAVVRPMEHDLDVPEFPQQYHHVLVHKVVEQLAARHQSKAAEKTAQRLAKNVLDRMKSKELDRSAQVWQRRPVGIRRGLFLNVTPVTLIQ
ncbi:MAG: hypothetical protein KAI25_00180 [Hyphomicrobiaceae bacterium]|nr:hypothetical protein [Hyphomicrobiaceae bacterium]